jgi:hypothetical protein
MTLLLHPLGSGSANCDRSESVPAPSCPPPFDHHLPSVNYLSFQQHSRFRRLTTFVFIDIPASPASFPKRPFVFIDIRASFVQF